MAVPAGDLDGSQVWLLISLTTLEFIPAIKAIKYAIAYVISFNTVAITTLPVLSRSRIITWWWTWATLRWSGTTYDNNNNLINDHVHNINVLVPVPIKSSIKMMTVGSLRRYFIVTQYTVTRSIRSITSALNNIVIGS
jgi:hypothetical protein